MYRFKLKENNKFKVGDVKIKGGKKSTVTDINPVTGTVTWDLEDVGAFDTVYKTFDKLNQLVKKLESEGEAEADPTIDSISDQVKKLFNQYRTHIRKNYPEAYERVLMVKEDLSIKGKKVKRINKNNSNNPEDYTVEYEDGTSEPYVDTLEESIDEGEGEGYLTPKAFDKNKKSTGAPNIYYYKLGYKPVPKKIKGSGLEVKQLFEKEELTEYSDFQQKRISVFDEVEEKINTLSPLLSNAKSNTAEYYNENPGSYAIVYSTDMVNELLDDITELLKQEE